MILSVGNSLFSFLLVYKTDYGLCSFSTISMTVASNAPNFTSSNGEFRQYYSKTLSNLFINKSCRERRSIRDDVKWSLLLSSCTILICASIYNIALDNLKVYQIAAVVGELMWEMLELKYTYFGTDCMCAVVQIATSSQPSAWGINWGETQRQSIYCDPKCQDGYRSFNELPFIGLGAAHMAPLLTYRSQDSFEARSQRNIPYSHLVGNGRLSFPFS